MVTSAYGEMEIERQEDSKNGTAYAFAASATGRGGGGGKNGDRGTAAEGEAGANDENSRGTGNSPRIITSTVMITSSAGTGSSTSYLHSSSSRNPSINSSRSSFPGILGVAAGASHHSSITTSVTVWAGAACRSNSPIVPAGKDGSCTIKGRAILVVVGGGGNYGALMGEVT